MLTDSERFAFETRRHHPANLQAIRQDLGIGKLLGRRMRPPKVQRRLLLRRRQAFEQDLEIIDLRNRDVEMPGKAITYRCLSRAGRTTQEQDLPLPRCRSERIAHRIALRVLHRRDLVAACHTGAQGASMGTVTD